MLVSRASGVGAWNPNCLLTTSILKGRGGKQEHFWQTILSLGPVSLTERLSGCKAALLDLIPSYCVPIFSAAPSAHLGIKAAGRLQEQRQVGLDLAAVGVGTVLGLALQGGDLVLKGVIPSAGAQQMASKPASRPQSIAFIHQRDNAENLQVLLHLLVESVLQVRHQHLLVQVLQGLPGRPHLCRPQLGV